MSEEKRQTADIAKQAGQHESPIQDQIEKAIHRAVSERLAHVDQTTLLSIRDWPNRVALAVDAAMHAVIGLTEDQGARTQAKTAGWHPGMASQLPSLWAQPDKRYPVMSKAQADAQQAAHERKHDSSAQPRYSPDHLSAERFGQYAHGVNRQIVDRWRRQGRVIALPRTGRGYRYPLDQLDDTRQLPAGLDDIIALGGNGHTTWHWLNTAHPRLSGETPLEALKDGDRPRVQSLWASYLRGDFE